MQVDRCVCFDVSFERLKRCADATGADLDGLQDRFGCGRGCGLCVPYIRRMLETGETSIPLMGGERPESSGGGNDADPSADVMR